MIEITLLDYLAGCLRVPVHTEMQQESEPEYVLIERIGGDAADGIRYASMAVKSCSLVSMLNAARLHEEVVSAIERMADHAPVYSARLTGDYNFTNPSTKTYRYQAVFDIYY